MAGQDPQSPQSVRERLTRRAELAAVYVLVGADEHGKSELAAAFAETVEADFRPFNVERFYGLEASMTAVLDAARTLPLMAERRIIVVQQADRLLNPKSRKSRAADTTASSGPADETGEVEPTEGGWPPLQAYLESPEPHAVILFLADSVQKNRLEAMTRRGAVVVECGLGGDREASAAWARSRAEREGVRIAPDALQELVARAGMDEARLYADTERVLAYVGDRKLVTRADVQDATGEASLQSEWAMVNAILDGETGKALRQLPLMFDASDLPDNVAALRILGQLRWLVTAPPPKGRYPKARVRQAVESLFRTDLALKTSGGSPRILLERLVVELCGGGPPDWPDRPGVARESPEPGRRPR